MSLHLDRREFLNGLMAVAAVCLQSGGANSAAARGMVPDSSLHSMKQIGKTYLKSRPHEASRAMLLGQLGRVSGMENSHGGGAGSTPFPAGAEALRALIRSDFAGGRTVNLDGWVLSESECRICALLVT